MVPVQHQCCTSVAPVQYLYSGIIVSRQHQSSTCAVPVHHQGCRTSGRHAPRGGVDPELTHSCPGSRVSAQSRRSWAPILLPNVAHLLTKCGNRWPIWAKSWPMSAKVWSWLAKIGPTSAGMGQVWQSVAKLAKDWPTHGPDRQPFAVLRSNLTWQLVDGVGATFGELRRSLYNQLAQGRRHCKPGRTQTIVGKWDLHVRT